eukprot:1912580-Rhodomonas_salina.1
MQCWTDTADGAVRAAAWETTSHIWLYAVPGQSASGSHSRMPVEALTWAYHAGVAEAAVTFMESCLLGRSKFNQELRALAKRSADLETLNATLNEKPPTPAKAQLGYVKRNDSEVSNHQLAHTDSGLDAASSQHSHAAKQPSKANGYAGQPETPPREWKAIEARAQLPAMEWD